MSDMNQGMSPESQESNGLVIRMTESEPEGSKQSQANLKDKRGSLNTNW